MSDPGPFGTQSEGCEKVEECTLTALDGAPYEACGDCSDTRTPQFDHYATPVYEVHASIHDTTERVLDHQRAIRDFDTGRLPLPAEPVPYDTSSYALEQLFPSIALEVSAFEPAALRAHVTVAGFWGTSQASRAPHGSAA